MYIKNVTIYKGNFGQPGMQVYTVSVANVDVSDRTQYVVSHSLRSRPSSRLPALSACPLWRSISSRSSCSRARSRSAAIEELRRSSAGSWPDEPAADDEATPIGVASPLDTLAATAATALADACAAMAAGADGGGAFVPGDRGGEQLDECEAGAGGTASGCASGGCGGAVACEPGEYSPGLSSVFGGAGRAAA